MIGAGGAAFVRDLAEGESLLVKPPALLFKDPTVSMQLHVEYPKAGMKLWRSWGNRYLWLRLLRPGPGGGRVLLTWPSRTPAPTSTTPRGRPSNSGAEIEAQRAPEMTLCTRFPSARSAVPDPRSPPLRPIVWVPTIWVVLTHPPLFSAK